MVDADPHIIVRRGPGQSLAITNQNGRPRQIERRLAQAGLSAIAIRHGSDILLPFEKLADVLKAFDPSRVEIDPALRHQVSRIDTRVAELQAALAAIKQITGTPVAKLLPDLAERERLDPHQIQAVAMATDPRISSLCLFDEQGLGKTVTTLFSFHRLRQREEVDQMLVVAPKNVVFEWLRDTSRFFGDTYVARAVLGSEREKRKLLNMPSDIYVTNFETVVRLQTRLKELLARRGGRSLLVIDESFYVKNATAQRTRAIRAVRDTARRCLVLCGTPAPNSAQDIVEQFNIADQNRAFHGIHVPKDRDAARALVQDIVARRGVYLRRLKQQVLPDLPGRTFNRILVRMQPEQEAAYAAALDNLIHELEAIEDVVFLKRIADFMSRRVALLQICSNPYTVVHGYNEVPTKLLALDDILGELISRRGEKVVVWSFFRASLDAIFKRYARFNPVRLDGSITDIPTRRDAVGRFQEDTTTMLFVGNPAAAGAGITLHRARYAIYESMSNQAAHYFQSLDRIHRRGQTREVEYLILLCDGTIEESQYEALCRKEDGARRLLRDDTEPLRTRTAMLSEALTLRRTLTGS